DRSEGERSQPGERALSIAWLWMAMEMSPTPMAFKRRNKTKKKISAGDFSCAASYSCKPPGDEGCWLGCHRCATRSCRHAHDRKTLRASCAKLRRRHHPSPFPDAWSRR